MCFLPGITMTPPTLSDMLQNISAPQWVAVGTSFLELALLIIGSTGARGIFLASQWIMWVACVGYFGLRPAWPSLCEQWQWHSGMRHTENIEEYALLDHGDTSTENEDGEPEDELLPDY